MFFRRIILQSPAWEAYTRTLNLKQGEGKRLTTRSEDFHSISLFLVLCCNALHSTHCPRVQSLSGSLRSETLLWVSYHSRWVEVGGGQGQMDGSPYCSMKGKRPKGSNPILSVFKTFPLFSALDHLLTF